jgi:hypothetical protein
MNNPLTDLGARGSPLAIDRHARRRDGVNHAISTRSMWPAKGLCCSQRSQLRPRIIWVRNWCTTWFPSFSKLKPTTPVAALEVDRDEVLTRVVFEDTLQCVGPVAQLAEQWTFNPSVPGSIPGGPIG